jgi:hypothetical protein
MLFIINPNGDSTSQIASRQSINESFTFPCSYKTVILDTQNYEFRYFFFWIWNLYSYSKEEYKFMVSERNVPRN